MHRNYTNENSLDEFSKADERKKLVETKVVSGAVTLPRAH